MRWTIFGSFKLLIFRINDCHDLEWKECVWHAILMTSQKLGIYKSTALIAFKQNKNAHIYIYAFLYHESYK